MKMLIVLTVLASLGMTLVGCDATTRSAPGNTTLGSAAVGGLAGATIGAIANDHDRGTGALVGGAIGAGTGALLGSAAERNRDRAYGPQYVEQPVYAPAPQPVLVPAPAPYPPPPVAPAPYPPPVRRVY